MQIYGDIWDLIPGVAPARSTVAAGTGVGLGLLFAGGLVALALLARSAGD